MQDLCLGQMMSWREEPSSVFDADIEEGRLNADGQHPQSWQSGEMNRLCRLDGVAVAQQRRFAVANIGVSRMSRMVSRSEDPRGLMKVFVAAAESLNHQAELVSLVAPVAGRRFSP